MKIAMLWLALATFLTGFWYILLKKASVGARPELVQVVHVSGTVIAMAAVLGWMLVGRGGEGGWQWGSHWPYAILAGILICIANICMFKAYQSLPLVLVVPVFNLACLVPLLFGFLVWRERVNRWQGLGILLALVAIILITYPYPDTAAVPEQPPADQTRGQ